MRWVRPILVIPTNASALAFSAFRRCRIAGSSRGAISSTAAICRRWGTCRLRLDIFTSSLGCTGTFDPRMPPAISMALFEITSLVFILLWVPLPVCQMLSGK